MDEGYIAALGSMSIRAVENMPRDPFFWSGVASSAEVARAPRLLEEDSGYEGDAVSDTASDVSTSSDDEEEEEVLCFRCGTDVHEMDECLCGRPVCVDCTSEEVGFKVWYGCSTCDNTCRKKMKVA